MNYLLRNLNKSKSKKKTNFYFKLLNLQYIFFRAYSLTGAYRKMIIKPEHLTWELFKYKSETDNLIQSDWEEIKNENKPEPAEDGELLALIVDFRLPSSTYATMVLREILKADTSASNQTLINKNENADVANTEIVAEKRKLDEEEEDADVDNGKKQKVEDNSE